MMVPKRLSSALGRMQVVLLNALVCLSMGGCEAGPEKAPGSQSQVTQPSGGDASALAEPAVAVDEQQNAPSERVAGEKPAGSDKSNSPAQTSAAQPGAAFAEAIVKVAKDSIPAVVHIEVTERASREPGAVGDDQLFRHFFGMPRGPRRFREIHGLGSGMILDTEGHILTNDHVVSGAHSIRVQLSSGEEFTGERVGSDPKTDLAIVRIPKKGSLPHVSFGDSDQVEVGEWVVAIGHPRGLDQTVTQGIVSAKHRRGITDPSSYQDFLQTDAAINPGNSGGPLLNLRGEVIGVNAVIESTSGGSEGIGFAVPSNIVSYVTKQLLAKGKVERAWLGVSVRDVDYDLSRSLKLPNTKGALVAEVVKGGPAEQAGVRKNDVVLDFNGKTIDDAADLRNRAAEAPVGKSAKLTVMRGGKKQEVAVTLASQEAAAQTLIASIRPRVGATVRAVTSSEADKYGLDEAHGVAIVDVDPKGPFADAGLEPKDLILAVDNQPIDSVESFASAISTLEPGERVAILALDHRTGDAGVLRVRVK